MSCITALLRRDGRDREAGIIFIVVAERRLEGMLTLAADEVPTDTAGIAAGVGVDQETEDGVRANGLEEAAAGMSDERAQNFVLLFGTGGRKQFHGRKHLFGLPL